MIDRPRVQHSVDIVTLIAERIRFSQDVIGASPTDKMDEIDFEMSNFDNSIDKGFAEALRAEPGKVYGIHSAWGFNGSVWFGEEKFYEEVRVYGSVQAVMEASTLRKLMDKVNAIYGCL